MINKLLEAKEDTPSKKKDLKKKIPTTYGKYSAIVDVNGKTVDNPTVEQSIKTMVQYLKKNTPESNVYRPEHAHTSLLYNKNKGSKNA